MTFDEVIDAIRELTDNLEVIAGELEVALIIDPSDQFIKGRLAGLQDVLGHLRGLSEVVLAPPDLLTVMGSPI